MAELTNAARASSFPNLPVPQQVFRISVCSKLQRVLKPKNLNNPLYSISAANQADTLWFMAGGDSPICPSPRVHVRARLTEARAGRQGLDFPLEVSFTKFSWC